MKIGVPDIMAAEDEARLLIFDCDCNPTECEHFMIGLFRTPIELLGQSEELMPVMRVPIKDAQKIVNRIRTLAKLHGVRIR